MFDWEHASDVLDREIKMLLDMKPDDPGYSAQVECVNKMARLVMDHSSSEKEIGIKKDASSSEKKNKIIGHIINAAGVVLPLGLYHWWMKRGFEFERTGAITSFTFKNLIGKLKPSK